MKNIGLEAMRYLVLTLAIIAFAALGWGQNSNAPAPIPAQAPDATAIARGKYLVEEVSKCADCHTPTTPTGEQDKNAWLKGATLAFGPIKPISGWNGKSPDITSTSQLWSRWGEDGLVKFFETGKNPRGRAADPPMPAFTLNHEDAVAIVAYLKSLK